ncbi:MAG: S-layer homology domain-containing protein, partial [Peptococcaceae bacterium]
MKKTVRKHVAEAALVSFTFASVLPGGAAFAAADVTDVNGHWAEQAIHDWMERGYIGGYEDNTFRPDQTITRAEFVKLVNKTIDADQTATIAFSDVSDSDWFAGEVALALGEGYVSGFEDGTFRPGQPVTRAQAAAFLAKALKLTGDADAVADMTDSAAIPDWAAGAIGAVVAKGYMGGYEDGTFGPNRPLTRAEAVSMLNRVLNDDGNEDTKPPVVIGGGGGSSSGGSSGGGGSVTRYTVTFDYQYDDKVEKETVTKGSKLDKPADPTRTGYIFGGWYTDEACTTAWNFESDTVREATTLYAKWVKDASVEVVTNEAELLAALKAGVATIELNADIELSKAVAVDYAVTINGNGHQLSVTETEHEDYVMVLSNGAKVDNVKFAAPGNSRDDAAIQIAGKDVTVSNCTFDGQGEEQAIAIMTQYSEETSGITITGNTIKDMKYGMYFNSLKDSKITGNTITNTKYNGINIAADNEKYPASNIEITGNTLSEISSAAYDDAAYSSGIRVGRNNSGITVENNTITMLNGKKDVLIEGRAEVTNEAELLAALEAGDVTINLNGDIDLSKAVAVDYAVTINGNGHQ